MENREISMTDRFVKRTEKAFLKFSLATLVIGGVVAVSEANKDAYIKTATIFGPLAALYAPFGIYERYLEKRSKSQEMEQTRYRGMTA